MERKRYIYDGPVTEHGRVINNNWYGETVATSDKKARSNLAYQFKKEFGKTAKTKIEIPGKIIVTNLEGDNSNE